MTFISFISIGLIVFPLFVTTSISSAYAGSISDSIRMECPDQYMRYEKAVNDYAIRMRDNVEAYGCGVVSAYGVFAEKDMDRIAEWEDNSQLFEAVNNVFSIANRYQLDIASNPMVFDALHTLIDHDNGQLYDKINQLLSYSTYHERRRINKEPERILYLMWALQMDAEQPPKSIFRKANHLRRDFPLESLPIALILDSQIAKVYPLYSAKKRLKVIQYVFHTYSQTFMAKVVTNKLALPNMVYLLPPQAGDIRDSQGLTDQGLKRLQSDYTIVMKEVIKAFEMVNNKFGMVNDKFGMAIDSASVLAPYIQQALLTSSALSIASYLKTQINSPVFAAYLIQQNDCNDGNLSQYVALFFSFLAPNKRDKDKKLIPIGYLQNNLAKIAFWYHADANMREWIIDKKSDPNYFMQNMAWLPYYYEQSSSRSRHYMSNLLLSLPGTINTNASFILALHQGSDYFDWLTSSSDADVTVIANDDVGDESTAKYRYILTTPFPAQDDPSVFNRFIENDKHAMPLVALLHGESVKALSMHEFTQKEKILAALGDADNALMVASFIAVPLTGGASLLAIGAAKMAAKQAAKKGLKYAFKVGYRYVRKTAARNIKRAGRRLMGKEGKKALVREVKELTGLAKKRGRPSMYANNQAKMTKWIEKSGNHTGQIQMDLMVVPIAIMLYCKKYANQSSHQIAKSLCSIQSEEQSVNQCKQFKGGVF